MILIADSGATKTDWCYGTGGSERVRIQTEGINPSTNPRHTSGISSRNNCSPRAKKPHTRVPLFISMARDACLRFHLLSEKLCNASFLRHISRWKPT